MTKFVLALVLVLMLFSWGTIASAFDGYYCDRAREARGLNPGWNFLCVYEVALDMWEDHFGDEYYSPF